jgi:type VI secretion system protein ImpK
VETRAPNLALLLQELFTAVERLRANRLEVSTPQSFRNQVLEAIRTADQAAQAQGYTVEDVRLAVFALVAFLDESILNLRKPVFDDWVRKPLQEEMFGRHVAGETFFENLQALLGRRDSRELADVLEIYLLCLLLGYLGRYSISSKSELRSLMGHTADKIRRIRNSGADLSPQWMLPQETAAASANDPWMRRLAISAAVCAALAVILFVTYKISLGSAASALQAMVARGAR